MDTEPFPTTPPETLQPFDPGPPTLRPLPFEDLEQFPSFWTRVGEMFKLVFTDPMSLFDRVPQGDGFGGPWRFTMLLSVPALALVGLIFAVFGLAAFAGALEKHNEAAPFLAFIPLIFMVVLALIPLFMFVGMVVGGALNHLFLWMWGGTKAKVPLEHTIRATGYANAFIQLGGWVPYLGILVQLAGLIWLGMGLARMHRTDTWRGICAALTPIFLLCGCVVIAILALPLILLGKAL